MSYLGGGGAERVMLNLAEGLIERGFQLDLVLGQCFGPHLKKVPAAVRIVDLKAPRAIAALPALVRYLRQEQPAALLSALHYANEIAVIASRLAGSTRVVVSEHNTLSRALKQKVTLKKRLIPLLTQFVYPLADEIVAVSQGAAQDLAQMSKIPAHRIRTIYNPVITPSLFDKAKAPLKHSWFAPDAPPVILGVGKLEAQKDFPNLIRAFAQVRHVYRCRLVILGWGPDRPQLEALIEELGLENEVALLGYTDNPYAYMARAAVFVLSSAWEGLPTVLIEAMTVGTPVVSTNCRSGPAEILNNGHYGALTTVGDSQALAQAILGALTQPAKSVDSDWLDQFTVEAATQQYLEALNIATDRPTLTAASR